MKSRFDDWGWFAGEATADDIERVTDVPPGAVPDERVVGELYPNWTGREWILLPFAEPQPAPTGATPALRPQECTPAQGLVALYALKGITEQDVRDAIADIADPAARYTAQIAFARATTWRRASETMQQLAELLVLSGDDLDALFSFAVTVEV